ncbi:MAG: tetratricopeptide repeat protein [Bacteroidales bacterium]|nr:tetratricopeptide repeat protein [Bacteroidales bacterium]
MKLLFTILLLLSFSGVYAQKDNAPKVPDDVEFKNFFSQADIFLLKGQSDKALSAYNSCLRLNPKSAAVNFQLARIYYNYHDLDAAMNYALSAVRLQPENYWYNVFLAAVYESLDNYPEALAIYEKLIENNPTYNDYLRLLEFYVQFGKISSAISTLNKIEEIYGYDFDLSLKKIDLLRRQNRVKEAENEFCKLILTDSSNLSCLGMLEDFYLSTSQISKAQEVVKKMQSIDDTNPLSYLAEAYLCRATGREDCFYENLKRSFAYREISVKEKVSIIEDIVIHSKKIDTAKISLLYEEVLKADGKSFEACSSYADFLMVTENYSRASEQLKICAEIEKSDFSLWRKLFKLYVLTEDYAALKVAVKEAEDYFPEQVDVMLYSAVAKLYTGDLKGAGEMFSSAKDFGVELTESANLYYFYYGVFNYQKSNKEAAFQNFEKYYNINHSDYNVCAKYAWYLIDSKRNLPLAQNIIKQCLNFDNSNFYFNYVQAFYSYLSGDLKTAEYFIEKALSLDKTGKEYVKELSEKILNDKK